MTTYTIPTSRTVLETKLIEGSKVFKIGKRFTITPGGTAEVVIQNPANSGKTLRILSIVVLGGAEGTVDIYLNSTIQTNGTTITPAPAVVGSSDPPIARVEYGGTYVINAVNPIKTEDVIPGGSGNFAVGGQSEGGLGGILPEGELLHIVVTNTSSRDAIYAIRILWWEE